MTIDTKQMDAVVIEAGGLPAQSLAYRREPVPEPGPPDTHHQPQGNFGKRAPGTEQRLIRVPVSPHQVLH